jgi:hypothetical protein
MKRRALLALLAAALGAALLVPAPRAQDAERRRGFSIEITSPENQDVALGKSRITAKVKIDRPEDVDRVEFLVSDKVIFVDREPPYECMYDFGESTRSWVIRASVPTGSKSAPTRPPICSR